MAIGSVNDMLAANTSIGTVLIGLIVLAVIIYGIAFIAARGAKRGRQ